LTRLELKPVLEAQCLFVNDKFFVFFFIDDIVVLYRVEDCTAFQEFHERLYAAYELRVMEKFEWFLGICIVRDREQRKLWLCLDGYINEMAQKYHRGQRREPTPLPIEDLVPYDGQASKQEIYLYQRKVGLIIYPVVIARPDIAFAAQKLAEFMVNPGPRHHEVVDRTIDYL
jgi:hypothetical protein